MTDVSHLEFCNKAYYFGTHRLRNDEACKSNLVKVSHTHCGDIIAILIFPIWRLSGIFLSPRALYAHRWVLDYYDSTTFGKQPRQVTVDREGQCCQRSQRVITLRRDIRLKSLSKGGECRQCYDDLAGHSFSLNWTLTVQTCCLEPVLNARAQVHSKAF